MSGANFLTGILFARFLGLEEYGRFTLAWMAILFFNSFQQAGIIAPMMSIGPKQPKNKEASYYGTVLIQQIIFSLICFFSLWLGVWLSDFFKPEWHIQNLALPLAAALLAWQLQDFLRRFFFVRDQGGLAFINDTVSYLGQLILLLILIHSTDLNSALVLWIIAGTSALAVVFGLFKIGNITSSSDIFGKVTRNHWHFSKWLLASALMQWTSGNYFIICAGGILGPSSAGALKAAQNIMGATHVIFQGLENIVPARASYYFSHGGWNLLRDYLKKVTFWGGGCTGVLAIVAMLFPEFLLHLLYGTEFQNYSYVLQWYAIIYLFIFLGLPLRAGLRAMEYSKPIFVSYCLMTAFTAATANLLIDNLGLIGATSGILCTQLIYQFSLAYALLRKRKCEFI